ncbi:hypothetical protein ACXPWS_24685 [Mycobacterium sp. BMJ-28]
MTGDDVDGALARGGPAVEVLTDYVAACRALGHPGADPAQLHDAYAAEGGMDLGALDADCEAVTAALGTVEEAVRLQDEARVTLADAWQGPAAEVAAQALAQHAQSSELAATALRRVADTLAGLRDELWQLVTGKVAAVQDIEDRAEREQWWPAARAVATGAGAQDAASEIVDGKVNPFVAVAIGSDWADVMDSTKRSVRDAYGTAAAGLSAEQPPGFGAPGSLLGAAPAAAPPSPDPSPAVPPASVPAGDPFSGGFPAGGLGSGMSSVGTGLTGAGQQIADLIGGLLSSGTDSMSGDPFDLGEEDASGSDLDEDDERDPDQDAEAQGDEDEKEDENEDEDEDDAAPDGVPGTAEEGAEATEVIEPVPDPATPTPVPEPVAAEPVAAPVAPEPAPEPPRTPCEIAADELPQAGE